MGWSEGGGRGAGQQEEGVGREERKGCEIGYGIREGERKRGEKENGP